MTNENVGYDIVPTHLAVQSMRDNGYKNTAYAIAELIDNSMQEDASSIELLCLEEEILVGQRVRRHLKHIAVLDNGNGMNSECLRIALQFGNGTRLETGKKSGIGRFGMGLPASSISQCTKVEVWTWQNGIDSAIYSYLDVKEIIKSGLKEVPEPIQKPIPDMWKKIGNTYKDSGTLVVWSNLDRCMWKTANAVINNSEFLIGRMYRRFLEKGKRQIRLGAFVYSSDNNVELIKEEMARPNDPLYLMQNSSCPSPWNNEAMFKTWGDPIELKIKFNGEIQTVRVTFSIAKEEARLGENPGSRPHGKHAEKNVGISIIRADRELDLDKGLVISYDTTERWWGVEIDFPPALDDLFGVTNNKQSARNLTDVLKMDLADTPKDKSFTEFIDEGTDEEDPLMPLIILVSKIDIRLKQIRKLIKAQRDSSRSAKRHGGFSSPERTATTRTNERKQEGRTGESDKEEDLPPEKRKDIIEKTLIEQGTPQKDAAEIAAKTIEDGLKYVFTYNDLETAAFFSVKSKGGTIFITLNTAHPAYVNLVEVLEDENDETNGGELENRLESALKGLKLLLMSWARYEDEQDGIQRERLQDIRNDWGRIARQFLRLEE